MPLDVARRGTLDIRDPPLKAIVAANDDYEAGYHKGNAGGLDAIDTDLATANIKNGITIFGVAGHTNVRDSSDANLTAPEAPTGKTFYAGGGARKTGSGTKTLNPANQTVAAGYYAATTLSAVDADLAVGNIKDGVTIFGFLGTFAGGAPAHDTSGYDDNSVGHTNASDTRYKLLQNVLGLSDLDLASCTPVFDATAIGEGSAYLYGCAWNPNVIKLRLYMDGVQQAESAYLPSLNLTNTTIQGNKAMSGAAVVKLAAHNYNAAAKNLMPGIAYNQANPASGAVAVGSVKAA